MDHSQWYIGTQNGVVVCVNKRENYSLSGVFFHSYSLDAVTFANLEQLLFQMEDLFNKLQFPYPSTNERSFPDAAVPSVEPGLPGGVLAGGHTTSPQQEAVSSSTYQQQETDLVPQQENGKTPHASRNFNLKRSKLMNDEQLLKQHGDLGSFIIRVQHRQNSSWQGRITWMEKNQTVYFRSVWEMMKLIEHAIDTVSPPEEELKDAAWPETPHIDGEVR